MKKLTIAIPTFNRSNLLKQCLDSILPQLTDEVNIIVSDNASVDLTETIMNEYLKNESIKYYRNSVNLGMDGNFLNCLKRADGEYIHLMSDDDIMLPQTISEIISCINADSPDLIHLNSCYFAGNFIDVNNCSLPRLKIAQNIITKNKSYFLETTGIYITFLSSLILKKELIKNISNVEQFLGTYLLHCHVALLTTKGDRTLAILKHNAIAARSGNTGGYNLFRIWVDEFKKVLYQTGLKCGYEKKVLRNLYISSLKNEIRGFILQFRLNNTGFDLSHRFILLKNTFYYPSIWFSVYPIAYFPEKVLIILTKLKKKI